MLDAKNLDLRVVPQIQKDNYHNIRTNPLFKRIMSQNAMEQLTDKGNNAEDFNIDDKDMEGIDDQEYPEEFKKF